MPVRRPPGGVQPSTTKLFPAQALHLDPAVTAARLIGGIGAFADDAFEVHLAGLATHLRRVSGDVLAEPQHALPPVQALQDALAVEQPARPQIPSVQRQQVEHIEKKLAVAAGRQRGLEVREAGAAVLPKCDEFAVEHCRLDVQARKRLGHRRQALGPIMTVAGHQPDFSAVFDQASKR